MNSSAVRPVTTGVPHPGGLSAISSVGSSGRNVNTRTGHHRAAPRGEALSELTTTTATETPGPAASGERRVYVSWTLAFVEPAKRMFGLGLSTGARVRARARFLVASYTRAVMTS
jgi:hypothetical protein